MKIDLHIHSNCSDGNLSVGEIVSEAKKEFNTNMSFGSGNEETTYLNSTSNCCGVDRLKGFSENCPCTVHTMFKIAKEKGRVTTNDVKGLYNPYNKLFMELWHKREKLGYFVENRVFKMRAKVTDSEVAYVYDETHVPN